MPSAAEELSEMDTRPIEGVEPLSPHEVVRALAQQVRDLQSVVQHLQQDAGQALRQVAATLERDRLARALADASRGAQKEARVVFVGRRIFGCNLKYAWMATLRRAADLGIDCWFLPPDDAQERLMKSLDVPHFPHHPVHWQAHHVAAALRAAVVVVGEPMAAHRMTHPQAAALLSGARVLQLWHGVPLKEVGLQHLPALSQLGMGVAEDLAAHTRATAWAGASAASEGQWRRGFRFERFAVTGQARNDVLLREPNDLDWLNVDMATLALMRQARAEGRRVLMYAPTYRDHLRGQWLLNIGLEQLSEALAVRGDLLVMSLHPHEQGQVPQLRPRYPALHLVAPGTDVQPLLREADALISDWSSLQYDYLLLDRPVVLWHPDAERFRAPKRQLTPMAEATLAGPVATSVEELIALLHGDLAELARAHAPAREALRTALFDHRDSGSADRVAEWVAHELRLAMQQDDARPAGTTPDRSTADVIALAEAWARADAAVSTDVANRPA